ncbi:hypothetical protein [Pseudonocardia kongjuensis]
MSEDDQSLVRSALNIYGDEVGRLLDAAQIPRAASPLFRPWGLVAYWDAEKIVAAFLKAESIPMQHWIDDRGQIVPVDGLLNDIRQQLSGTVITHVVLPHPPVSQSQVVAAAARHFADVERDMALGRLGNLAGVEHLEPALREFIADHPDPSKNVFVMMRFKENDQMSAIHRSIADSLAKLGFHAIRADDRDYTGELWTNVQVCMTGCQFGIAVFEDIDDRDFNPNVSLELGYMLASQKRCLILKEKRLPNLPADVLHRLYKDFDMFKIEETVAHQLDRWIRIDLRAT